MVETTINLDEKGKKILRTLRFKARMPSTKMSKEVGVSKESMSYRLKNMCEKKIITKFFPELSPNKIGLTVFQVALKLRNMNKEIETSILKHLDSMPVLWIGYMYGEWDVFFSLYVKSSLELDKYINKLMQLFGQYIVQKGIGIQVHDLFMGYDHIYGRSSVRVQFPSLLPGADVYVGLEENEKEILSLLYDNARMSYLEISNKLSMSPEQVKKKIKRMENEGIILRYLTSIDRSLLGFRKYKVLLHLKSFTPEVQTKMLSYFSKVPNVTHLALMIGPWDAEVDYDAETLTEFHSNFRDFRDKFSDHLTDYSVLVSYKYVYLNPFDKI